MSRTNETISIVETDNGLVFLLDEDVRQSASIVVEVETKNQPLLYGAGDLKLPGDRTDMITATKGGIIIHKCDNTELAVPVNISGESKARIYQYGKDSHIWIWFKTAGETFIKEVQIVECGKDGVCLCQKGIWMFTDHTHLVKIS